MATESERPSSRQMALKIAGPTLIMAGVVFMIAGAELMPGLALCVGGIAVLVVAGKLRSAS